MFSLGKIMGFSDELNIVKLNKMLSDLDEENIRNYMTKILNQGFKQPKKEKRTIVLDASPIPLDINLNKKFLF